MIRAITILAVLGAISMQAGAQIAVRNQGYIPFSDPPINYRSDDLHDPVAKLEQKLEKGTVKLQYDPEHGYLPAVLALLQVPVNSQTLVFSKTSFQYPKISPEHPRALYYNDDVYVGSVHEGKAVEIVSFDPMQGAIFYLLDERKSDQPRFQRAELDCTQCHIAAGTRGVPGVLLRSIYATDAGTQVPGTRSFITDQESPFSERWGGWYVTGALPSMANAAVPAQKVSATETRLAPLPQRFNASSYLTNSSDVVAHLVLAHQTQMHNLITLTNYKTRLGQPYERPAEQLLRYLLFSNEVSLAGTDLAPSPFARDFQARGVRDAKGRSLRDFDLHTRIFRYPCSYLIYSDAFDSLPEPAKGYVYHRLLQVLSAEEQSADFARLTPSDRQAVLEILLATKPGLPAEWQQYARSKHLQPQSLHLGSNMRTSLVITTIGALLAGTASAETLDGRWDAALLNNGPAVPFRLDISGSGPTLKATFYDGSRPYESTTSASFKDGKLVLNIDHYLTTITATLEDGELTGTSALGGPSYTLKYDFHAVRHVEPAKAAAHIPAIAGSWEIPLDTPSPKGEKAFRLIVKQSGADAEASILRVDGDTGAYSGRFENGKWILSHFDGHRPGVIELSPGQDGTLQVIAHNEAFKRAIEGKDSAKEGEGNNAYAETRYAGTAQYVAYRSEVARAKNLPAPENYETHTTVRDPNEKFAFKFPDADGRLVSNEDPRFKGKVVLAIVTGTWCPNCHDEAQFLVQLDKKYRSKGLEIVALDFEEPEQQGTLLRERAFVKQYGVEYTYLIAGAPAEMWEKVPQLVNLNTWPATVFVGRDGLVKSIHSGFASPASGDFNRQLKEEFTAKIEKLLAEKASVQSADAGSAHSTRVAAN